MKVEDVMNRTVFTCKPQDSLRAAAQQMWERDIGCLVVVDDRNHPLAVVTDRDLLMCAYFSGTRLEDQRVARAMSKELHSVQYGQPLRAAEALMKAKQVRRLAVLDRTGSVAGILSLNDLALASGREREIKPEEIADTLASICQPRATAIRARS